MPNALLLILFIAAVSAQTPLDAPSGQSLLPSKDLDGNVYEIRAQTSDDQHNKIFGYYFYRRNLFLRSNKKCKWLIESTGFFTFTMQNKYDGRLGFKEDPFRNQHIKEKDGGAMGLSGSVRTEFVLVSTGKPDCYQFRKAYAYSFLGHSKKEIRAFPESDTCFTLNRVG